MVVAARQYGTGRRHGAHAEPAADLRLVGAGTVVGSKAMFEISALSKLRVFINVPQIYSPDAKAGVAATLTLPQYPGRKFEGKLVRTSDAVDPATRTLLAEVEVSNASGELLPGSYAEVHLHTKNPAPA